MRVALKEIESSLSDYVTRAREGEVIEITVQDVAVARIVGIPPLAEERLARLTAEGAASWGGGKPEFRPPVALEMNGKNLSELVLEERG